MFQSSLKCDCSGVEMNSVSVRCFCVLRTCVLLCIFFGYLVFYLCKTEEDESEVKPLTVFEVHVLYNVV